MTEAKKDFLKASVYREEKTKLGTLLGRPIRV